MNVDVLLNKTMKSVVGEINGDVLTFTTIDGEIYELYHSQDCCESVCIEDICGDLDDLVGSPLLVVEEVSNYGRFSFDDNNGFRDDSFTWTFYKFATIKGYVTVRLYGASNGYYSESVDFGRIK